MSRFIQPAILRSSICCIIRYFDTRMHTINSKFFSSPSHQCFNLKSALSRLTIHKCMRTIYPPLSGADTGFPEVGVKHTPPWTLSAWRHPPSKKLQNTPTLGHSQAPPTPLDIARVTSSTFQGGVGDRSRSRTLCIGFHRGGGVITPTPPPPPPGSATAYNLWPTGHRQTASALTNWRADSSETKGCPAKDGLCPARCDSWLLTSSGPVKGPPSYWVGWGWVITQFVHLYSHVPKAWCLAGNLVYNQTARWRRSSYLVYKQTTRGQRCSYWKTAPYVPRFTPKTVDAPINPVRHIGRKLRYIFFCGPIDVLVGVPL